MDYHISFQANAIVSHLSNGCPIRARSVLADARKCLEAWPNFEHALVAVLVQRFHEEHGALVAFAVPLKSKIMIIDNGLVFLIRSNEQEGACALKVMTTEEMNDENKEEGAVA